MECATVVHDSACVRCVQQPANPPGSYIIGKTRWLVKLIIRISGLDIVIHTSKIIAGQSDDSKNPSPVRGTGIFPVTLLAAFPSVQKCPTGFIQLKKIARTDAAAF